jgi:glycosyltransferase involved in cell wall biosynthesis
MRKKVLILANNDIWLYKLRKETIKALLDSNFEVYISSPKGAYIDILVEWGCIFIETNVDRRGKNLVKDYKLLMEYFKVIRKIKPDVVLAYTIKPNLYGGLVCRVLNIPCINNITGLGSGFIKNSLFKTFLTQIYKISLKNSYTVFFQNINDQNILVNKNILNNNYRLLPGSGVNLEEYSYKEYPKDKPITFIFIGRIMKDKGIDQYLEAAKLIKGKNKDIEFNLLGFVEETEPHYNELIQDLHNEGVINYLGFQSDVRPYIHESQCIIQASHGGEGLSNVLLETAATGRSLIASNIFGCKETINDGENGYIFEAKNTNDLVDKIEKFISLSYNERVEMGKASRVKIEKEFDRNLVVDQYMKKINQICNS